MDKNFSDNKTFHKQGNFIVFLFCLNFLFSLLAISINFFHISFKPILILIFTGLNILCFIVVLIIIFFSIQKIKSEENSNKKMKAAETNRFNLFQMLMKENLFEYHFQPIINARTGEIFAYEALMRSNSKIGLSPLEILEFAAKENKLYDIELYTFSNTLKILKENSVTFQSKKLFINCLCDHLLTDSDFDKLYNEYGTLFENIVLEISEACTLDENGINRIQKRLLKTNCQLSLEDYGIGNLNESNILKTNPNYIKIDRSIFRSIHTDSKRQNLVSNIIEFAQQNKIKTIAEGIETYEEFKYVINLGIDYIQGFYTARPNPVLLSALPNDYINAIKDINLKRLLETSATKDYEAIYDNVLSLISLSLGQYTNVVIYQNNIILHGNQGLVANLNILIPDNSECYITLDNINLRGNDNYPITIGNHCSVTLNLVGDNTLSFDGIRVPESSNLTIIGDGNLTIDSNRMNGLGIGGTSKQSYGNITISTTGTVNIKNQGDMSIGIGGAYNSTNSLIHLETGLINIETSGYDTLGIGSVYGNAIVKIDDCQITLKSYASNIVGIGCINGSVAIESSGHLQMKCEGRQSVVMGALINGVGAVTIYGGSLDLHLNSHYGVGIGSIGGNVDIYIEDGDIEIHADGTDIVGIGDLTGTGNIHIYKGVVGMHLHSLNPLSIGNKFKKVIIDGGNIQCDFSGDSVLVNDYNDRLVPHLIATTQDYHQTIEYKNKSYEYYATYSERYPNIITYLPKEYQFE